MDKRVRRYRLETDADLEYPVLDELRESGFTDYVLVPMVGTLQRVHVISVATRAPGGLAEAVVEAIVRFCAPFGLLVDSLTTLALSEVLLRLYVGNQTGPRVLQGEVRLGQGQSIHAAILYSDMRGFSQLCSVQGTTATIDILNIYFDIVSRAVHEASGEVLKLMGDAILAVFPVQEAGEVEERRAAEACLRAARTAHAELERERDKGAVGGLRAGFGLTLGEVVYGNIGAPGRLDFTIIGDAVNLAARIEELSKDLKQDVLLGPRLAARAGVVANRLGPVSVRGFSEPLYVYVG
jgi:adenylate cyclase